MVAIFFSLILSSPMTIVHCKERKTHYVFNTTSCRWGIWHTVRNQH